VYSKRGYGDLSLGYNDINKTNVLEYFSDRNTDIKYVITGINFTLGKKSSLKNNVIHKIKKKSGSKNNRRANSKNNRKSNSKDNYDTSHKKSIRKPKSKTNRKSNSKNNSKHKHRSKNKLDMLDAFKIGTKKKKPKSNPYNRLYGN
jgi:hypothetical protein